MVHDELGDALGQRRDREQRIVAEGGRYGPAGDFWSELKNANAPLQPPVADTPQSTFAPAPETPMPTIGPLLTLRPVSLGELVSDAVASSAALAEAKGVRLDGRVDDEWGPATVRGSAPELTRVVHNLLDNAIRHTPAGRAVEVLVRTADGRAEVAVHDGCGGIPDDDLDRVFDLAYRGDAARTPGRAGGAGLGLAIARGLVSAHHGDIAVRNEAGGCRFVVRIPLA